MIAEPSAAAVLERPALGATHTSACDFCSVAVPFRTTVIGNGPFTDLVADDHGAGSDYLSTWCAQCGPKHRAER